MSDRLMEESDECYDNATSPWIPVSERLPENGTMVLTYGKVEGIRYMARGLVNTVGNGFPVDTSHYQPVEPPK